jgi:DNA invertase Pin-like site-specific DNA recombinase
VSTDGQTVANQRRELEQVAVGHGWHVVEVFADGGVSGAKGRDKHPAFNALCNAIMRRDIDIVVAWSVDRLGRSFQDLVGFLGEMKAREVDLYLHQQGLDTSTPAGHAMFQMLSVFAEFERAMIQERVRAGLARARAEGKQLGRPPVSANKEAAIRTARADGKSIRRIAADFRIAVGTVHRIVSA